MQGLTSKSKKRRRRNKKKSGVKARDRLRAWDVENFYSSNFTHKSCGIFVTSWVVAHCIGTRLLFHFFYLNVRRTNEAMQQTHKVLKMR